jgi:glycosyltransferase involved in cell wall biosynthesis
MRLSPMRVGINLLYLLPGTVGGTETYAAGLLQGLAQIVPQAEFVVFVNREAAHWPIPEVPNVSRVVCPVAAVSRSQRYFFEQLRLPGLLKNRQIDLVHSLGYVAPLFAPCPSIVTVPDLNYRAFGNQLPLPRRLILEFFVEQSVRRASYVLTLSEFSRSQIITRLRITPERVQAIYLAPRLREKSFAHGSASFSAQPVEQGTPYIIAFSSHSPNKNIPRLLQAFAYAKMQYQLPHHLVLVGHPPDQAFGVIGPGIHFTGYLEDAALQEVLTGAQLLVFPSTYEGFGLPILEAMAQGIPVVCSDQASLPEVADEAALYFNPFSVEAMAQTIAQVALNPSLQSELRQKGFEHVRRFSWEKLARETLSVYERVYRLSRIQAQGDLV